jgi:hypothetical protein
MIIGGRLTSDAALGLTLSSGGYDHVTSNSTTISTVEELVAATHDESVKRIVVQRNLDAVPGLVLRPGQSLRGVEGVSGSDRVPSLGFVPGSDGLKLSSDNRVEHVQLLASPEKRAIFNDVSIDTLGIIEIRDVTTIGRVHILASDNVRAGHVEIDALDIIAADARAEKDRPHDYGVSVLQGALTLWNMQPDANVELSANLTGISVGRVGHPVLGSGVLVGGAGDTGGRLWVQRLETKGIYSNGMIAAGTADQIAGGVFAIYGARVDLVLNTGPVITYGTNDMALDNWATVDRWIAREKIVTLSERHRIR